MEYRLRAITNDDVEPITRIFLKTYAEAPWNETWDPAYARERIQDYVDSKIAVNFGAVDDNGTIRAVLFGRRNYYLKSKELFVDEFFVDSEFQHRGVGSFMIGAVAKEIKNSGYSCIILNTEKGFPSERFYLRNGFRQKESNIFMYKNI